MSDIEDGMKHLRQMAINFETMLEECSLHTCACNLDWFRAWTDARMDDALKDQREREKQA